MKFCRTSLIATILTVLPYSMSAFASDGGLFVEPMVTYQKGDTSVNLPSPLSDTSGELKGFGLGARAGFHIAEILFAGADVRYSMPTYKNSVPYDAKAIGYNWGPVVGAQMPIVGLRVWGSYILGGELDPEASGNLDVKFRQATGYRIGAGMHVAIVSLNLEYQDLTYGNTNLQKIGPYTVGTDFGSTKLHDKSWIASVSFPMEI